MFISVEVLLIIACLSVSIITIMLSVICSMCK
jgi:hypothetical protein